MDIVSVDIEISAIRDVGRYHVKSAFIVSYSWGIDTATRACPLQRELTFSCENMTYLLPIHKIVAFIEGNAREELKRAANKIVFALSLTNARVRVKA